MSNVILTFTMHVNKEEIIKVSVDDVKKEEIPYYCQQFAKALGVSSKELLKMIEDPANHDQ